MARTPLDRLRAFGARIGIGAAPVESFESERFALSDMPEGGSFALQAFGSGDSWSLVGVERMTEGGVERMTRRDIRAGEAHPLVACAETIAAYEREQRAEGRAPVAGGDAASLGARHVGAFMARRGWLLNDAAQAVPFDARLGLPAGEGTFDSGHLALAQAAAAGTLPAIATVAEAPAPVAGGTPLPRVLAGLDPVLDRSVYSRTLLGETRIGHGIGRSVGEALSARMDKDGWLATVLDTVLDGNRALFVMDRAAREGIPQSPRDLALVAVTAVAFGNRKLATLAADRGADLSQLGDFDPDDESEMGLERRQWRLPLELSEHPRNMEALLNAGLPTASVLAQTVLLKTMAYPDGDKLPVLRLLTSFIDLRKLAVEREDAVRGTLSALFSRPDCLDLLMEKGLPVAELLQPDKEPLAGLMRGNAPAPLWKLEEHHPELVAGLAPALLVPALERHAAGFADIAIRHGALEALSPTERETCIRTAVAGFSPRNVQAMLERRPELVDALCDAQLLGRTSHDILDRIALTAVLDGRDESAAFVVEHAPRTVPRLLREDALPALVGGKLPTTLAALTEDPALATQLAEAMVLHGQGQPLMAMLAEGKPALLAAVAAQPAIYRALLLEPGHEKAAAAVLPASRTGAGLLVRALTHEGQGCALAAAVRRGEPALVTALMAQGAQAIATLPDGETALHVAAREGSPAATAALLAGLPADAAQAGSANEETPADIAARRGDPAIAALFASPDAAAVALRAEPAAPQPTPRRRAAAASNAA